MLFCLFHHFFYHLFENMIANPLKQSLSGGAGATFEGNNNTALMLLVISGNLRNS
jgi:hypothetical protein